MRACGIGALSFVRIVSVLSFAALGLSLINALYFAPRAAADLLRLENQLKTSQASFEVQPRVFYEDFKNYVLYVQDAPTTAGVTTWHHVFLANLTDPTNPNPDITTADQATASAPSAGAAEGLRLHLLNGGQHQLSPTNPNQYDLSTFASTEVPIQFDNQDETHISRSDTPMHALPLAQLWQRSRNTAAANRIDRRAAQIELNTRFSYPVACLF